MEPFELRGEGLILNQPTLSDVTRIVSYCQDVAAQRFTTIPVPYTDADAVTFVTEIVPSGWRRPDEMCWAIRTDPSSPLLGTISLRPEQAASAEIGFLVSPDARGKGVCERACRLVIRHALSPSGLGAERIVWRAAVGNWASRRVAWKLGFRLEGTIRADVVLRGERVDGWIGTLLAGDPQLPNEPWAGPPNP